MDSNCREFFLVDYNARFYSPSFGKFIQPDTIVPSLTNSQSWNRYSYTLNNPVKYIDPSGHMEVYGDHTGNYEYIPDDPDTSPSESDDQPGDIDDDIDQNSDEKNPGIDFCEGSVDTNLNHPICRFRRDPEVISYLYEYCIVQDNPCSGAGAYRYFEIGTAIPTPYTGTLLGWNYAWTKDFYGNKYNTLGVNIGESTLTVIDLASVVGYPGEFLSAEELPEFISGWDFDISIAPILYLGGTFNLPFGNGGAFEIGISNPSGGLGITFTWQAEDDD